MPPKGAVSKAKAPKKPKAKKDPNAPKKPSGAYIWFCNDHRAKLKGEHAEWGVAEIGKELGKMWGELDDNDKKKYINQAEKDKVRYQKDLEKYNATKKDEPADEEEEKPAKKAAPKKRAAPKKKKEPEPEPEEDEDEAEDLDEDEDE